MRGLMKRQKTRMIVCTVLTAMAVLFSFSASVQAAGQKPCSLGVTLAYKNEKSEKRCLMQGVEVKIAQVAELTVKNGVSEYKFLPPYDKSGLSFEGMYILESHEGADILEKMADQDVQTGVTDKNGRAFFDRLHPGVYLIFQDKNANDKYQVEKIESFLAAVPQEVNGIRQYAVEAEPKTVIKGEKPSEAPGGSGGTSGSSRPSDVKTGDESRPERYLLLAAAAFAAASISGFVRMRKKK